MRLLIGGQRKALRDEILEEIADGTAHVVVGTHAIIEDKVAFQNLGLAVVDEQHRFGVVQRSKMFKKGQRPHVLMMTATPIPRSLAMTVYGDLDVSAIDELPAGRKPIDTRVYSDKRRDEMLDFVKRQLREGRQAYVVYPLVEESEAETLADVKDAENGAAELAEALRPYRVELVHGRMLAYEKEEAMDRFKNREADVLVATTVIEVGVDVPNATVMVIEHAERFGLAQLHQLRGRVGRGADQSYCFLMASYKRSAEATERLEAMEGTTDGFEISEIDLRLRGAGDFFGTRQSGLARPQDRRRGARRRDPGGGAGGRLRHRRGGPGARGAGAGPDARPLRPDGAQELGLRPRGLTRATRTGARSRREVRRGCLVQSASWDGRRLASARILQEHDGRAARRRRSPPSS